MVEPVWFFSTLAQATAASIGFLIAFLAALYTARKSKTQDNYREFMTQLQKIEADYKPLLRRMENQITGITQFPISDGTIENACEIDIPQTEIESIAEEYDQPTAIEMWANLKRSQKVLDQLVVPQPNNKQLQHIQRLNESSKAMFEQINTAASAFEFLGDTSIGHLEPEEVREKEIFPEVEGKKSVEMKGKHPETKTFQSWETILGEFRQETIRAGMWTQNSELTVDFEEFQIVLDKILVLFFVGVAFPIIFLLTYPDWWFSISGLVLTIIQAIFIVLVSYLTVGLFSSVKSILNYSNKL